MTPLFTKATIAAGGDSGWFPTNGETNVVVKVEAPNGSFYEIEVKDTETGIVDSTGPIQWEVESTVIAKAFKVRIVGDANNDIVGEANA